MAGSQLDRQARQFNKAWTSLGTAMYVGAKPREGIDLSDNQLLLLYVLDREQQCRVGVLAEYVDQLVPAVSRTLSSLEGRGLVQRRPDPEDRRASLVEPTKAGTAVVEQHRGRLIA